MKTELLRRSGSIPPHPQRESRDLKAMRAQMDRLSVPNDADFETQIFLPFSSLVAYLKEGDFIEEGARELDIHLLRGKRQLGVLHSYGEDLTVIPEHDRFFHSLQVALIMRHALKKAGCSLEEQRLGEVAGLLHDRAMPAGGDAIKRLDPPALEEEDHWNAEFTARATTFLRDHKLQDADIDAVIHNKGAIGQLLDAADRISYTLTDLWRPGLEDVAYRNARMGKRSIHDLAEIFDDLIFEPHMTSPIFRDAGRLADFLLLRAEMFSRFYCTPANLARDAILKDVIQPFYARDGSAVLSPASLRGQTDSGLYATLAPHFETTALEFKGFFTFSFVAQSKKMESMDAANAEASCLRKQGLLVGISQVKGFNTSVNYHVRTRRGDIPMSELMPKVSDTIQRKSDATKGIMVHWTEPPYWMKPTMASFRELRV